MSQPPRVRFAASPLHFRLAWASGLLAFALLGCDDDGSRTPADPTAHFLPAEREQLASFVSEIRRAYEMGNAAAVEALINPEGTPEFLMQLTRRKALPKGPMKVVDVRVEERRRDSIRVVTLDGVDYGFNVEPIGALVIEMEDVSIGEVRVDLIIGEKDGALYIAGLRPLESSLADVLQ